MTSAQQQALAELLPVYGASCAEVQAGPERLFSRRAPLHLEIGFGNGENLVAMAAREPHSNFLGCEVHRPGLGHALLRLRQEGLQNLRLLAADALEVLDALPCASLAVVCVFFPDPWPKKRHHKRRLLQQPALDLLGSRLAPHGRAYFASDHAEYAVDVRDALHGSPRWRNLAGPKCWAPRPRWRTLTRFEARAQRAGARVYELAFALDGAA